MAADSRSTLSVRVLVVDDEATIRTTLGLCLEAEGHEVVTCANASEALAAVSRQSFDLVYLDLRLGMDNGLDLIPRLLDQNPWARIVVITAFASIETAVEAMRRGAADYLPKPFTPTQVEMITRKVAEQRRLEQKIYTLQAELGTDDPEADFVSRSLTMIQAQELALKVAGANVAVCIEGEIGSGRERLARAIHAASDRVRGPFASLSCAGGVAEELEADLFGSTGRASDGRGLGGRVEFCSGGTLLLKEITELPVSLQPKLARLLREREYERCGEFSPRSADCRIIVTSSVSLDRAAQDGAVRPDLALAASVINIRVPPLRDRPEDIEPLADRFVAHFSRVHHRPVCGISRPAAETLQRHSYPGNIRELRSLIERAVLICPGQEITLDHLPANLLNTSNYRVGDLVPLEKITDLHIKQVLASTPSYESAASVLGINSITLWRRRKRYNA